MPHILIVDAREEDARQIGWMLGGGGEAFTVTRLERLPNPVDRLVASGADLLLLSLDGEVDGEGDDEGLAPLERLREQLPELPVILLGHDVETDVGRRAIRLGAQDHLVKSQLDPASLRRAVLHALERSRAAAPAVDGVVAVLDRLPHGVVLLDAELRVRFASAPARALLAKPSPLLIGRDRRLRAMEAEESRLLGALIRATSRGEMEESGRALLLGGHGDNPRAVMVTALEGGAALFISDPHAPPEIDRDTLAALYALTPAESKLVALLTRGLTLDAIAERSHVSPHTLRTQLKQVFRKTGTARQSELIKLILTGPAAIAAAR